MHKVRRPMPFDQQAARRGSENKDDDDDNYDDDDDDDEDMRPVPKGSKNSSKSSKNNDSSDDSADDSQDDDEEDDDDESDASYSEDDDEDDVKVAKNAAKNTVKGGSSNAVVAVEFMPMYLRLQQVSNQGTSTVIGEHDQRRRNSFDGGKNSKGKGKGDYDDDDDDDDNRPRKGKHRQDNTDSKKSKHAPAEMKSNRPVPVLRDVGLSKTTQFIDPRFSNATGKLDEYRFYKDYEFIDDIQKDEIKKLEKVLKKVHSVDKKQEIQKELGVKKQKLTEKQRNLQISERMHNMFAEEHKKVASGKTPFFLKKSEIKKVAMEEKFKDLKKSGKLGKYMEKKRKRNSSKDHVSLPSSRRFKSDA